MFNDSLIARTRWGDIATFFESGNPPLILKILAVNTIFLLIFVYRRAKAKHRMRPSTAYFIQAVLIAVNMFVLFQKDIVSAINAMTHAV
jgi:hypothetical protein